LAEAESELVSGFMTEHAAVIFVFFFLAEYASIVLICILTSILFLGGYLYDYLPLFSLMQYIDYYFTSPYDIRELDIMPFVLNISYEDNINILYNKSIFSDPLMEGLLYGLTLGIKSCIMIFVFI
jgi:NADH-ubiquinone oxidoreductase chain 1